MNLPDLLGKVKIDNSQAKSALNEIKTEAGGAGAAMGTAGKSAAGLATALGAVATVSAAVLVGVKNLIDGFVTAGSELVDLNKQLGIGVVEIQKIQYAAKQSGVEFGAVTTAIMQMEKAASKTPEKFAQLGISFGQLRTARPDELLRMIADGLGGVTDQNEKARIAMEIFGRGGSQMLKMLGSDYRELGAEAEKSGLMTAKMAEKADALGDAQSRLSDVVDKLKNNLGAAFANPIIISGLTKMADLIGFMSRHADKVAVALANLALPGLGNAMQASAAWDELSGPKGGATTSGPSNARQYTTGKGYDATTKAMSDLDKALDKLARRMDNDAVKAADKAESAEARLARTRQKAIDDFAASFSYSNLAAPGQFVGPENPYELKTRKPSNRYELWGDPSKFSMGGQRSIHVETQFEAKNATKANFDFARSLQNIANVASTSSSKLARAVASVAGGGAGIASGLGDLFGPNKKDFGGGLTGILGKVGVWGGIASAGISLFSGLFGGGKRKEEERKQREAERKAEEEARIEEAKQKRISGLSTFSGGMNQYYSGGISDQASADRAGRFAMFSFGQQVKESGDIFGALNSIGPTLDAMAKAAKEFGLEMPKGVESLLQLNNLDEGIKSQVSGLNAMTKGIGESGLMTKDLFNDLGAEAVATRAKLEETGLSGAQSMALMQPSLQQLYEAQKLHGYAVDETTQALLDEAKAQGVVGDQFMSANERMVELLGILIEAVGGKLPDSYKKAGDAAEDYGRRARGSMPPAPPGPGGGSQGPPPPIDDPGPGFAGGSDGVRDFGSGTRVTLHGREAVLTEDQLMAMSARPSDSGRPLVVQLVMQDGRLITELVTNTAEAEGPEAQRLRSALAGRG